MSDDGDDDDVMEMIMMVIVLSFFVCVTGPTKMHAEHESDTAQSRTQIRNCEHKASATAEAENVAHSAPDGVKQYGRHSSRCGQPHGEAPTMSEIDHELS